MVFRWRPRSKPPSNVIPFPVDRTKKGLPSLIPTEPTPPVDLGQKKKEIKKKEQREQLLDWLAPPEVPTKEEGLSGLEEPPKKFKGLHEAIEDLSESMKKFNERHDFLLQREGLSELGEDLSLKGLARKVDTISKYSESELKKAKKDIQDGLKGLKILEKADKDNPHIAEEQRQRNIKQKTIWEYMLKDINKRLSILAKEKRPIEKKKMSSTEKYYLEAVLKKIPEASPKKGIRSLVDENRLKQKLNKVGLGLPLEEGATDRQKYDKAVKQQQSKDLSHLDHFMITDVEFKINKLIEEMNVNKPTEELVYDLGTMLDYVDWDTDYKRSGRYEGPDKRRHDRYYSYGPPIANQKKKVSGGDAKLQKNIYNLVYKIKAEIEKRMRDE
jgi:hypothetical protein